LFVAIFELQKCKDKYWIAVKDGVNWTSKLFVICTFTERFVSPHVYYHYVRIDGRLSHCISGGIHVEFIYLFLTRNSNEAYFEQRSWLIIKIFIVK
jgi:hypothetical protein